MPLYKLGQRQIEVDVRAQRTILTQYVPLRAPLTSGAWDGDSFSDVGTSTQLDLSSVFSAPAGIKAVLMDIRVRDSATWGSSDLYFACGPSSAQWAAAIARPFGGDVFGGGMFVVPCDSNGDVWYQINTSGSNTMDIWIYIWGYWI